MALVASNVNPPVAKLIDYGKYRYQQKKLAKKQRKKEGLKEIRLSLKISEHDLGIKAKKTEKFLEKGYKVRINLRLKGREMQFKGKAFELLNQFVDNLKEKAVAETRPYQERKQFITQLKPKQKNKEI